MYSIGSPVAKELSDQGLIAGILPKSMTEEDYLALISPQKDLIEAIEKAERRIKREKKQKEKDRLSQQLNN